MQLLSSIFEKERQGANRSRRSLKKKCAEIYLFGNLIFWSFHLSIFALLLFSIFKKNRLWCNCSRRSLKKSNRERIALVDLWKRSTVSESIRWSLKKSDTIYSVVIPANRSQKTSNLLKKTYFTDVFDSVPPFLCKQSKSLLSIFALQSFLKLDGIDSLLSIFEKDRPWANRSHQSLKIIDRERINPEIFKKGRRSDSIFFTIESIFRSQKQVIQSKNWWSNSQPYKISLFSYTIKTRF